MKKYIMTVMMAVMTVGIIGCETPTTNIDTRNDTGGAVMGLDYRDFEVAASEMLESMSRSAALTKPGGEKFIMTVSNVVNDTTQRINVDQLIVKIRSELLKGGRVQLTSAVGARNTDNMIGEVRELRNDNEFNQDTTMATGELIAPELSLSGKIIGRNIKVDRNTQQVEYYFQLMITNLKNGLVIWEDEKQIGKRGSDKAVSW